MIFRLEVCKRLVLTVDAGSETEARALALVVANGSATPTARQAVRYLAKALSVETCEVVDTERTDRVP